VLAGIAIAVLALSAILVIGLYRRRLPEQPLADNLLVQLAAAPCACLVAA
jgi:phosphatidylglycerol lysyltransferase